MLKWLKKKTEKTVAEVLEQYQSVVIKYPTGIIDVSMLPVPKSQMKRLLKELYTRETRADFQKYLEDGFFFLSKFQEGVGNKPIDGKLMGGDFPANTDANLAILERHSRWLRLQVAELDILSAEWKQFKEQLGSAYTR